MERIYDGNIPDVKPPVKRKLKAFIEPVRILRKLDEEVSFSVFFSSLLKLTILFNRQGTPPADLIRRLVDLVEYEEYLKHKDPEWATRWENVQELINFASEPTYEDASKVTNGDKSDQQEAVKYGLSPESQSPPVDHPAGNHLFDYFSRHLCCRQRATMTTTQRRCAYPPLRSDNHYADWS